MPTPLLTLPAELDRMDRLERLSLATTLLTLYLCQYFTYPDSLQASGFLAISVLIILLNAVTCFFLGMAILREMVLAMLKKV